MNSVITITFSESVENHVGMEKIGEISQTGFTLEDFKKIKTKLEVLEIKVEIINLKNLEDPEVKPAYVLVARSAVNSILAQDSDTKIYNELLEHEWDSKYYDTRRKKVLNKHARKNICIDEKEQKADYENKKGTVVAWKSLKNLKKFKKKLEKILEFKGLKAEGNLYSDPDKNGIGFHGDSERRKVIAIRLGKTESMPLHYQWYHKSKRIGERIIIPLNAGDLYIMSEKAVGTDWKCRSFPTLRHATGASKYIK